MGDSESERCRSVKLDNTGYVIFVDSDRAIVFEIVGTDDRVGGDVVRGRGSVETGVDRRRRSGLAIVRAIEHDEPIGLDHGSTTSAAASSTTAERD
jgi:hypothetical protein